jgi:hypothetical protein
VEQSGQQLTEDDEENRDHPGGREHLADHHLLGRRVDPGGGLEERDERDLRPDADEQQQEGVDHQGDVDRRVIHRLLLVSASARRELTASIVDQRRHHIRGPDAVGSRPNRVISNGARQTSIALVSARFPTRNRDRCELTMLGERVGGL